MKIQKRILFIIASTLLCITGLISLITIDIHSPKLSKDSCAIAHEDYDQVILNSPLGIYENFAISVDSADCATVGRYKL